MRAKHRVTGLLLILLVVITPNLAFGIELKDPKEFQAEVLTEIGVPFELHQEFAETVAKPSEPVAVELKEPLRIGFATPSFDISDAWGRWYWSMYYRLEEAGISFETNMQATRGHEAHAEQLAQVENLIAAEVDFIILGPTQLKAQRPSIEKVHEAGIPLIVINLVRPLPGDDKTLMYTAFDHEFGGYLNGVHIAQWSGGKGTLAGLRLQPGPLDDRRWGGAMAVIDQTDIEVVYETYAKADRQQAYDATVDIMTRYPDLALIYATSSSMALGAASALETMGKAGEVGVWGFGGTVDEVDYMQDGLMTGSVFRFSDDGGAAVAEAIKRYIEGRKDEIPRVFMGDMTMAHADMSQEEFRQLLERAHRYSKQEMGVQ